MDLCGLTDDLLRKILHVLLSVRVLMLPPRNDHQKDFECRAFRARRGLGMTCKRLHGLLAMHYIRDYVMQQLRTVRYDFWRRVAATATHSVMTTPLAQIWLTARLSMNEKWIRVVTTVVENTGELRLQVTAGNTTDLRRRRTFGRIDMYGSYAEDVGSVADLKECLQMECIIKLQMTFKRVVERCNGSQGNCLFLL